MQLVAHDVQVKHYSSLQWNWVLKFTANLLLCGIMLFFADGIAVAQRRPIADDTLGTERSIVTPDPANPLNDRIDGGATRGENLFHSFQDFGVGEGRSVYFSNPSGIRNILSRVTGINASEILGVLGVLGDANLFLLNPNGIFFGPNAQLDIRGSFLASTADSFVFDNGFAFSATNPQAPPLLTVNVPIGLQYGSNPGAIQVQQALLQVPDGQTLTLAGGTVDVDGAGLFAFGGRVELAGVAAGVAGLTQQGQGWRLSVPEGLGRADVEIGNNAFVDVSAGGGGSIAITARNFTGTGAGTGLRAGIATDLGTVGAQAGNININTTETINLDESTIENLVDGTGNAGDINITTGTLSLTNGAYVETATYSQGDAGNVNITASDAVFFDGVGTFPSGAYSRVYSEAIGQGGDINITTGTLSLTNGGIITASIFGQGDGGNISITSRDAVSFDGGAGVGLASGVFSPVTVGAIGQGGDISITAGSLSFTNGGQVTTTTLGKGDSGNITIIARDTMSLDGVGSDGFPSAAVTTVESVAIGQGGDLSITTGSLSLTNGAQMGTSVFGRGDAGNITIIARDTVSFDGTMVGRFISTVSSSVLGVGQGGNIRITTGSVSLTNGVSVSTVTGGQGDAGNIIIAARDAVSFDGIGSDRLGSGVYSSVLETGQGQGGNINITAGNVTFTSGGVALASTFGQGDAGNVAITARDRMFFDSLDSSGLARSGAYSTVEAGAIGQGGNIDITTGSLSLSNGAQVSAATSGQGRAGDITFNAPTIVISGGAQVLAETSSPGNGGNIVVNAPVSVDLRRTDDLSPVLSVETSGAGQAGDITITTPNLTLAEQARITATARDTATNPEGGGSITINASNLDLAGTVGVFAETQSASPAGTLTLRPDNGRSTLDIDLSGSAEISASTSSSGRGGNLIVTAPEAITIRGNGRLSVETTGTGRAGDITITAPRLTISDGAVVSASTSNAGAGGSLSVNAPISVQLINQGQLLTESTGSDEAGNLTINTPQLTLEGEARISASNQFSAGGDIQLQELNLLSLDNSSINASTQTGAGGSVRISMRDGGDVALNNNSRLAAEATGGGNAGSLRLNNIDRLTLQGGSGATVSSIGQGTAGALTVDAQTALLDDRSTITGTTEAGIGGNISLNIAESLRLNNNSQISASTQSGRGGDITIQDLDTLRVLDSLISAESVTGRAGELTVNASDFVLLDGRGDRTRGGLSVRSRGGNRAGNLTVTTNELNIQNGAAIAVSNTRQGDAGDLIVNARDISLNRGSITGTTVAGTGGDIQLNNLDSLRLSDRSAISASTRTGQGGSLSINTREDGDLVLSGDSNLAAEANSRLGIAGSLEINNADDLAVADRSAITVSNRRGNAGNLRVNANSVTLDNGTLEAIAGAGRDGNIELNASGALLQLSNTSRISAQALNQASGGNVILDVSNGFVVANPLENSDILANAEGVGNGGNINITTQSIFGLAERDADSPFSDINASSQVGLDGTIELNTLNIDPTQGLAALPENVAPPDQIDQRCATGSGGAAGEQGEFVVSGRGGLPPNAEESLSSDAVQVDLVTVEDDEAASNPSASLPEVDTDDEAIVEAQGWVVDADGGVVLTAVVPTVTPTHSQPTLICSPQ